MSILEDDTHYLVAEGATVEQVADATLSGPVAVSPQGSLAAPVVAFLRMPSGGDAGPCEAQLQVTGAAEPDGLESRESVVVQAASCPGSPVVSPSGQRVAWIEGGERMMAVDIGEALANDGMADSASWELEAAGSLDFRAWLSSADGWKLVVAEATGGADQLHLLEIERQADGALALPAGGDVVDERTAVPRERLSPVAVGMVEPREPQASEVDLLGVDEANIAFLRRGELADGGRLEVVLGQDVGAALFDEEALEPVTTAWITSHGRDALLGDGQGMVWHVLLPERAEQEPVVTELDADWTGAAFLPGRAGEPGSSDAALDGSEPTSSKTSLSGVPRGRDE